MTEDDVARWTQVWREAPTGQVAAVFREAAARSQDVECLAGFVRSLRPVEPAATVEYPAT